tara:strand:+ start:11444 stop:12250 length:807 start_codon:yes stop_codon:yes gene_type:complete
MHDKPVLLAFLNAISTGTIINLVIMSFSQYYTCDPVFETPMMDGAIVCDIVRYCSFLIAIAFSVPYDSQNLPDSGKKQYLGHAERAFSTFMCLICTVVLVASLAMWNDACSDCVQRDEKGEESFAASLGPMLGTSITNPCENSGGQLPWFNAESWCRSSVAINCANAFVSTNVQNIRSVQSCVRWGCTDFLPEAQYAYFFEVIGDVSRIVLFYFLSLDQDDNQDNQDNTASLNDPDTQSLPGLRSAANNVVKFNLRNRKQFQNSVIKF